MHWSPPSASIGTLRGQKYDRSYICSLARRPYPPLLPVRASIGALGASVIGEITLPSSQAGWPSWDRLGTADLAYCLFPQEDDLVR